MIGNTEELTTFNSLIKNKSTLYIPLSFYFQNNPGLSLPLIALLNSKITLNVTTKKLLDLIYIEDNASLINYKNPKFEVLAGFVYLEEKEREIFGRSRHEYLIEEVQYITENINSSVGDFNMQLNNPVKDMFFVLQNKNNLIAKQYWNYTNEPYNENDILSYDENQIIVNQLQQNSNFYYTFNELPSINNLNLNILKDNIYFNYPDNPINNFTISFNGHNRCDKVETIMTNLVYPVKIYNKYFPPGLNVFPFCLYPLDYQPSGTCNYTYLNNKHFSYELQPNVKGTNSVIKIFAKSYNILRITSGISCLAI